ncbi:4-nitrophenylphosphatase-related [Holotrichia oblita]|uniref:4-nitrophenylphosphatase-related n=2 Tax=Holotrichia oblita TaxID=644536 RepID=A0ACB9TKW2_HOLOL|nr:4-nitrophenylphosphatase-related [Holotrichia oblita]KAI4467544.1 4-nitrophenylphosphatase-related [Holotrichia oblita]
MIRAVLIDLSGTLHIENQVIAGAVEALLSLRKIKVAIKFVTNTTKECKRFLHERLTKLGFQLERDEIHSSLGAARSLIIERKLKPLFLLSPEAMEDFEDLVCKDDKPNAVVIGLAPSEFHYEKLNEAFRCLLDGAHLIAIHAGRYYRREDGLALGPGCFIKGLEYSANCKAELVGKPNSGFFKSALGDIKPEEAVMIGDDILDDIKGAIAIGMKGILVKTGKYREGDEHKIETKPAVVANFSEAVQEIIKIIKAGSVH